MEEIAEPDAGPNDGTLGEDAAPRPARSALGNIPYLAESPPSLLRREKRQ
jgi:hypothetical protein